jgi:hypothetical protein
MSVQVNQYLCYGYLLAYKESEKALEEKYSGDEIEDIFDKYHDSAFSKEVKEIDGCSLISDGMNGEYNFFGKVFKKSDNYEHIQTTEMPKVTTKIKKNIDEQLIKVFGTDFEAKPKVILLTHYR